MIAVYISSNQFKVEEDHTEEFKIGRRIKANCGDDGYVYSTILSSFYSSSYTTITITESTLTSNLIDVLYGIVNIGETGAFPDHLHDGAEGQGGALPYVTTTDFNTYYGILQTQINNKPDTFLELIDTPSYYDSGKYAISTSSGILWATAGSSNVQTFLDLTDTPITYSGTKDLFAQSTGSGIVWTAISGLEGADGVNGMDGVDGIDGADGNVWLSGTGAPSSMLGSNYDFYFDEANGDIYAKDVPSTTNVLSGGTISSTTPPVTNLSNVLDGNINTYTAGGAYGSYYGQADNEIKYDLGAGNATIVTSSRHYASYASCDRYTIQGSNNNVDWTILYDRIDDNNPAGWRESGEFTNTTAYRYYRLLCTKAGNGFSLGEWQLIGSTYVWDLKFNTMGPSGATVSGITFLDLTDTPESYVGNDGKFVKVVGNTLEFSTISGASGLYDSSNLLELDEYGGLMPVVTISGINDIVLTASDNSKWRLIVSTTGILSTEVF